MSNQSAAVTLTTDQLKELFMAFATELKKPAEPTEAEKAIMANDQKAREDRARMELEKIAQRRAIQATCTHTRQNGSSHCVHIFGDNNLTDYMICQGCNAQIHAGVAPSGDLRKEFEGGNHIFDTQLFNKHYLMTASATTF